MKLLRMSCILRESLRLKKMHLTFSIGTTLAGTTGNLHLLQGTWAILGYHRGYSTELVKLIIVLKNIIKFWIVFWYESCFQVCHHRL